ncbi:MAG: hypothetical protein GX265_02480 [Mollicutes bacterium]|jgi:stage V sporulation protein AD|nr:hypothetical protein [Mollicutes bacterium]
MFNFKDVYLTDYFIVAGPLEKEHDVKKCDMYIDDYYFGEKTVEDAEIKMQRTVLNNLVNSNTELIIGGDLTNQLTALGSSTINKNIPVLGIYSACATMSASFLTLAGFIQGKFIREGIFLTSSHNLAAEKQFRFPVEYGAPKPYRSTFTATAAVGIKLSKTSSKIKVVNGLLGKVIDSYVKDVHNMGAIMAPGAATTLVDYLNQSKTEVKDYDLIITGDLGSTGSEIFKEILKKEHNIKINNHLDAGAIFYKDFEYAGASGPAVLPLILVTRIFNNKKYKKILCLATGSLHSPVLVNQKHSVPTICHAIYLEVV